MSAVEALIAEAVDAALADDWTANAIRDAVDEALEAHGEEPEGYIGMWMSQ